MCGAFATRPASRSKTAQEKSSRSRMFVESEVRQHDPHLLGDRHEQVVHDLEPHRVDLGRRAGCEARPRRR
jgi:hypothetical protein